MLLQKLPKNSEFTYGVHKDVLALVAPDNAFTLMEPADLLEALKKLDQGVMGSVRALNHLLELLRQGIAYGLTYKVEYSETGKPVRLLFAVYKRNKANNEGQLTSKLSLGAGGHIEGDDVSYHTIISNGDMVASGAIDMLETLDDSYIREYSEEVELADGADQDLTLALLGAAQVQGFQKLGFVMDSQATPGYVGNIHFGVVYALEAPNEVASFEMRETQNEAVAWASVNDLIERNCAEFGDAPFEPWSQMIVDQAKAIEEHILKTWHGVELTPLAMGSGLGQLAM